MGINVHDDNRVEFDDTHQDRVDTSLARNMSSKHVQGVPYHFIFRRKRSRASDAADGNPLIYALKEMKGFRMDAACRTLVMDRAQQVVLKDRAKLAADAIISIPSSYSFCNEFSEMLGAWLGIPVIAGDFIGKKTVSQVLAEAQAGNPQFPNSYVHGLYKDQIKKWQALPANTQVALKHVDTKIRPYFNHLALNPPLPNLQERSVLVVDDIMASGTSLRCTIELLQGQGVHVASGVCFLSGL